VNLKVLVLAAQYEEVAMKHSKTMVPVFGIAFLLLLTQPVLGFQSLLASRGNPWSDRTVVGVDQVGDVFVGGRLIDESNGFNVLGVVKFSGVTGDEIWRRTFVGSNPPVLSNNEVNDLHVNSSGEVTLVGTISNSNLTSDRDVFVARLAGTDGVPLWTYTLDGTATAAPDAGLAVGEDNSGNAFVVGYLINVGTGLDWFTVKLDGSTGSELWRQELDGTLHTGDIARDVAVDSQGDVFSVGMLRNDITRQDAVVIKYSGIDGAVKWQQVLDSGNDDDEELAVEIDANDDVFASGYFLFSAFDKKFGVSKFSGIDGTELWRREILGSGSTNNVEARSLAVTDTGDIVVGGVTASANSWFDFAVMRFAGVDGAEQWRTVIDGGADVPEFGDEAFSVTLGSGGDIIAVGFVETDSSGKDILAVKLAGVDGAELWRRTVAGHPTERSDDIATDIAIAPDGGILVVGSMNFDTRASKNPESNRDVTLIRMDQIDGGHTTFAEGKKLSFRRGNALGSQRLSMKSRDAAHLVLPVLAAVEDPTVSGGMLGVMNPDTGEADWYGLPATGWTAASKAGKKNHGFRYKDRALDNGPCRRVVVGEGKLSAKCKGDQITFSLDEATQGRLAVLFGTGPYLARYCFLFDNVRHDDGTKGVFVADESMASSACAGLAP